MMKSTFLGAAVASSLLFPLVAMAAPLPSGCPVEYAGGTAPEITSDRLSAKLRELCFSQFAVYHSGISATPLFVAQRLTGEIVSAAKRIDRDDVFHAEPRLPKAERGELVHYRSSGFDRGHMAPAADMATKIAQDESFSLANMVPQKPSLNRKGWADIEEETRRLALRYGEVYVVTGPAFQGDRISRVGGRVLVPTAVFKAVFIPSTGQSSAWWGDNDTGTIKVLSVSDLASRIGADVFPSVADASKSTTVSLPVPKQGSIQNVSPLDRVGVSENMVAGHKDVDNSKSDMGWWLLVRSVFVAVVEFVATLIFRS